MVADQNEWTVSHRSVSKALRDVSRAVCRLFFFLAVCAALFCPGKSFAQGPSREYQVKAAFLFNFAQFVQWPAETFTNAEASFCIGILGEDAFGGAVEEIVKGESIQNHKIIVLHARRVQDLDHCQMVFITKSERGKMGDILPRCTGKKMLTVSETPGFANRGGVINFYLEGSKVRFEINPAAAQREGLKMSSQLLNLGKIVEPEMSRGNQ